MQTSSPRRLLPSEVDKGHSSVNFSPVGKSAVACRNPRGIINFVTFPARLVSVAIREG
jgi:hypothetical protein